MLQARLPVCVPDHRGHGPVWLSWVHNQPNIRMTQPYRANHAVLRRLLVLLGTGALLLAAAMPAAADPFTYELANWSTQFSREVSDQLNVPIEHQQQVFIRVQQALSDANLGTLSAQTFVVIDRSPQVQAAFVLLLSPANGWQWLGATTVSTGKPGGFEHFFTPLGVFLHTPDNPDFRSEGTYNSNHIRGYGERGMRVFDFGWQLAERGWGTGGSSKMRLAMHATDPERLVQRLGTVASEGCIRIPAQLNRFLDTHGVLDADYEAAATAGQPSRVLRADRLPLLWPGRYLVIIDSGTTERPAWSQAAMPLAAPKPSVSAPDTRHPPGKKPR